MTLRRAAAALLEWEHPWPAWIGLPGLASPVRRLELPADLAVVGVGGPTLGGSGKTPLAIALATELSARGLRVVFVGHGYRSRPPHAAMRVTPSSTVDAVGDEALIAAQALGGSAPVVVGPSRAAALSLAAELGDVAVVDGLLQTTPVRLAYSVLALDPRRPWGSGRVVPFGDLRAPPASLRVAADELLAVGGPDCPASFALSSSVPPGARVALVSSMARPARFGEAAGAAGVVALFHVKRDDHRPIALREAATLRRQAGRHRLDAWCVDAKTHVQLQELSKEDAQVLGAPIVLLRQHLEMASAVVDRVAAAVLMQLERTRNL